MGKIIRKMSQYICDTGVSIEYFNGIGAPCNDEAINEIIIKFMDGVVGRLYIGVTHHPCGRFTGNKTNTRPLPSTLKFNYNFIDEEPITEAAHYKNYHKMYLICYSHEKKDIFQAEKNAIKFAKEKDISRVINDTDGGNGSLSKSEIYWLYICVANELI